MDADNPKTTRAKRAIFRISKLLDKLKGTKDLNYFDESKLEVYTDQLEHIAEALKDFDAIRGHLD
jgi:hypothetical protein